MLFWEAFFASAKHIPLDNTEFHNKVLKKEAHEISLRLAQLVFKISMSHWLQYWLKISKGNRFDAFNC